MASETDVNSTFGAMQATALEGIFETASELNCDLTAEFAALGLTQEIIEQGSALFSFQAVSDFLLIAIRETGRVDFVRQLTSRQDQTNSSGLVLLLKTAPTLRDSFRKVLEFGHIYASGLSWMLESARGSERLCFTMNYQGLNAAQHQVLAELVLAQSYQFIKTIIGEAPPIERVYFAAEKVEDSVSFSNYYKAPVEFDADYFGLQFIEGTLDKSLLYANRDVHENVERFLTGPETTGEASLERRVRAVIRSLLPTQTLSIQRVAQTFDCCERTLQRRLKVECGLTYCRLVADERFDLARQFLELSNMSVTDLAFAVGFSNSNNFTRAFKNSLGCSPREWRKRHKYRQYTHSDQNRVSSLQGVAF